MKDYGGGVIGEEFTLPNRQFEELNANINSCQKSMMHDCSYFQVMWPFIRKIRYPYAQLPYIVHLNDVIVGGELLMNVFINIGKFSGNLPNIIPIDIFCHMVHVEWP